MTQRWLVRSQSSAQLVSSSQAECGIKLQTSVSRRPSVAVVSLPRPSRLESRGLKRPSGGAGGRLQVLESERPPSLPLPPELASTARRPPLTADSETGSRHHVNLRREKQASACARPGRRFTGKTNEPQHISGCQSVTTASGATLLYLHPQI